MLVQDVIFPSSMNVRDSIPWILTSLLILFDPLRYWVIFMATFCPCAVEARSYATWYSKLPRVVMNFLNMLESAAAGADGLVSAAGAACVVCVCAGCAAGVFSWVGVVVCGLEHATRRINSAIVTMMVFFIGIPPLLERKWGKEYLRIVAGQAIRKLYKGVTSLIVKSLTTK